MTIAPMQAAPNPSTSKVSISEPVTSNIEALTTPGGLAVHTYAIDGPATTGTYDPAAHAS